MPEITFTVRLGLIALTIALVAVIFVYHVLLDRMLRRQARGAPADAAPKPPGPAAKMTSRR
jgi:hypothetical protein